jgi:hypothetical protein
VDARREPLLTFAAIEPVVEGSRAVRFAGRILDALARASFDAGAVAIAARLARLGAKRPAEVMARAAWLIAIAAMTHIAMLLFVERYHFPNRAALILPILIAVIGLVVVRLSDHIGRALVDRHHR